MATWINMRLRILCIGDSITHGLDGETGGWRKGLSEALAAAGHEPSWAGPYIDAIGSHRGLPGAQAGGQTSALQTECMRYAPTIVIIALGINDASQTREVVVTRITNVIGWVVAGVPNADVFVQTVMPFPAQAAKIALINDDLVGVCATAGVTLIDVGDPARDAGGVHPIDGPTGYDAVADIIAPAVLAVAA